MIGSESYVGNNVSVVHVLWEWPVYDTIRNTSMGELEGGGGGGGLESLALSIILREQALF